MLDCFPLEKNAAHLTVATHASEITALVIFGFGKVTVQRRKVEQDAYAFEVEVGDSDSHSIGCPKDWIIRDHNSNLNDG